MSLAGNDDASASTRDSQFTVYLNAGTRYALAVTNYTGSSNGGYKWSITGPPLQVAVNNNAGGGITSFGSASLVGNTLTVFLSGLNSSNFTSYTHRVNVYLMNGNNRPIHSGSWSQSFRTGGRFVSGVPSADTMTRTYDLSGWDLRSLRNMRIVLS